MFACRASNWRNENDFYLPFTDSIENKRIQNIENKLTNLVTTCDKSECPCKAFNLCHYVSSPKNKLVTNDIYKINHNPSINYKSNNEFVNPYVSNVKHTSAKTNLNLKSRKPFCCKLKKFIPHSILNPRCCSCKRIKKEILRFILTRKKIIKKNYLLKNSNIKRLLSLENFNKEYIKPFNCLKCTSSLKYDCLSYDLNAKTQNSPQTIHPSLNEINNKILLQNDKFGCTSFFSSECFACKAMITNTKLKSRNYENQHACYESTINNKKIIPIKFIKGVYLKKNSSYSKCCKIHNLVKIIQRNDKNCTHMPNKKNECNCNLQLMNKKLHDKRKIHLSSIKKICNNISC